MPFYDLSEMPSPELFPGWHGKVIHSERMTFVRWSVPAGAVLPNHAHPHEQLAHLISGEFELTIGGETRRIRSGSVAVIPPNTEHSGIAITACEFTDSFCPIREDYRK